MFKELILFTRLILDQRFLIWSMARREIASMYVGSSLGFIWTIIHPLIMIGIFWVVFGIAFKARAIDQIPFVVWLTAGMAPWFLFADIVTGSSTAVTHNSGVIKKTRFQSQILPIVKTISCSFTHMIFLAILLVLIIAHHLPFSFFFLQFLYYYFCTCVLAIGLGWLTGALNPFIRDTQQIISVAVQLGMWATPILWDLKMMPESLRVYFKLNPVFYIVQGYRDSFLFSVPFWEKPHEAAIFWAWAVFFFILGGVVFKRLKPHFADVL